MLWAQNSCLHRWMNQSTIPPLVPSHESASDSSIIAARARGHTRAFHGLYNYVSYSYRFVTYRGYEYSMLQYRGLRVTSLRIVIHLQHVHYISFMRPSAGVRCPSHIDAPSDRRPSLYARHCRLTASNARHCSVRLPHCSSDLPVKRPYHCDRAE